MPMGKYCKPLLGKWNFNIGLILGQDCNVVWDISSQKCVQVNEQPPQSTKKKKKKKRGKSAHFVTISVNCPPPPILLVTLKKQFWTIL